MYNSQNNFLDYQLFEGPLTHLPKKSKLLINTINQYSFCLAERDKVYKQSLQHSDILLPDGIGVTLAAKFLTGIRLKKIAGADIHEYLLNRLNQSSGSCFYLGATEDTLVRIKTKLSKTHPNVLVSTFSPPFKTTFSTEDNEAMVNAINKFKPQVLFVGMTAPKQEKWVFANQAQINVGTICTIGAVFDFYAGTITRPRQLWINLGLEWFVRLLKEPKRMAKRYLYFGPIFLLEIIKFKFGKHSKN